MNRETKNDSAETRSLQRKRRALTARNCEKQQEIMTLALLS